MKKLIKSMLFLGLMSQLFGVMAFAEDQLGEIKGKTGCAEVSSSKETKSVDPATAVDSKKEVLSSKTAQ